MTTNSTAAGEGDTTVQGFCITCGFNFGHLVGGIDDKVMGLLLVFLFFSVLCLPFIIMSGCYLCGKKKKKYTKVTADEEDNDNNDNNNSGNDDGNNKD